MSILSFKPEQHVHIPPELIPHRIIAVADYSKKAEDIALSELRTRQSFNNMVSLVTPRPEINNAAAVPTEVSQAIVSPAAQSDLATEQHQLRVAETLFPVSASQPEVLAQRPNLSSVETPTPPPISPEMEENILSAEDGVNHSLINDMLEDEIRKRIAAAFEDKASNQMDTDFLAA